MRPSIIEIYLHLKLCEFYVRISHKLSSDIFVAAEREHLPKMYLFGPCPTVYFFRTLPKSFGQVIIPKIYVDFKGRLFVIWGEVDNLGNVRKKT